MFFSFAVLLHLSLNAGPCARQAYVGDELVQIDYGSEKNADVLRMYLEKSPESISLLDKYQAKETGKYLEMTTGTIGSIVVISALTGDMDDNLRSQRLLSGMGLLFVGYLFKRTLEFQRESILEDAVRIYNLSHTPKIFLSPTLIDNKIAPSLNLSQDF